MSRWHEDVKFLRGPERQPQKPVPLFKPRQQIVYSRGETAFLSATAFVLGFATCHVVEAMVQAWKLAH